MKKLRRLITKRACVRLTLLLVAGAIVNVAVAWGFVAATGRLKQWGSGFDEWHDVDIEDYDGLRLREFVPQYVHDQHAGLITSERLVCVGMAETWLLPRYTDLGGYPDYFAKIVAGGWPILCVDGLVARQDLSRSQAPSSFTAVWAWVPNESAPTFSSLIVPLRPLWPGFAINTVFYAAILWMLYAVPFALRRRLRVKRALCVKCAYDLRGRAPASDVCPECGWGTAGGTPTP